MRKSVRMLLQTRAVYTGSEKHPPRLALQALPRWQAPGYCFFDRCRTSFDLHSLKGCSGGQSMVGVSAGWVSHGTAGPVGTRRDALSRVHSFDLVLCLANRVVDVIANMIRA